MRRARSMVLLAALSSVAAGLVLAVSGLALVNHLESQRSFCTACHLPDGTPLHARKLRLALRRPALDLAGVHFEQAAQGRFNCADCHRGVGWDGRAAVLWGAAEDTLRYALASYHEPRRLTPPMDNTACTGCHRDVTRAGNPHRFHGLQAHLAQTMIRCTSCHIAHARWSQPGREAAFLRHTARGVCGRCHKGDPPATAVQNVLNAYQRALLRRMEPQAPVAAR